VRACLGAISNRHPRHPRFIHDLLTSVVEEHQALEMVRLVCKDVVLTPHQLTCLLKIVAGETGKGPVDGDPRSVWLQVRASQGVGTGVLTGRGWGCSRSGDGGAHRVGTGVLAGWGRGCWELLVFEVPSGLDVFGQSGRYLGTGCPPQGYKGRGGSCDPA
jgi:hypothetical protein